ncbi:hypothetical protein F5Y16DRAFT_385654 [Xylariaceae sp. FL0255]|nr:hypothetical protein F5Y16DRAFT_385654 [Xylariaceae sp. FL0255]
MSGLSKPPKPTAKRAKGVQIRPSSVRLKEVLNQERGRSPVPPVPPTPKTSHKDRPSCPNPRCPNPSAPISDGFCSACGREIDASNIVSEVQFGETSSGAAVLQGTTLRADQGATRSAGMGIGIRRLGGLPSDNREKTIREARNMMYGFKSRLKNISESAIESAIMIFKLLLNENWLQGRGMEKVVPVCLYAACRREDRCDVMLIDFAELVHINVFELGHVFKDLSSIYSFPSNNVRPIIPEDLLMRFAEKLDFGEFTNKIAADAARLCRRMARDWINTGRRPSGICGACLLMAARMWNFRRTVKEVVYVVKVTTHTIQQRLEEFNVTESSDKTIEDFLTQEFLESSHDPPAFYKNTSEWIEKEEQQREASGRKRKREMEDIGEDEIDPEGSQPPAKQPASAEMPPPPRPLPPPDVSKMRQVTEFLPRSFDNTESREIVTPFDHTRVPDPAPKRPKDIIEGLDAEDPTSDQAVDGLLEIYGSIEGAGEVVENQPEEEEEEVEEEEGAQQTDTQPKKKKRRTKEPEGPLLNFDEEWHREEAELIEQINHVISDPHSSTYSKALATAAHLAYIKAEWARSLLPSRKLNMEEIIGEDEFADDPEVQFCELTPNEVLIKEEIWLNANRDWVRKQQEKTYRAQMEELGPPKRRRNRGKKPRIGEGQLTPASTPGEAVIDMMKKRNIMSKRINYDAITSMFDSKKKKGPGSVASRMESETASRITSRAGSILSMGSPQPSPGSSRVSAEKRPAKPAVEETQNEPEEEEEEEAPVYDAYEEDEDDGFENGEDYDDGEGEVY